MEPYHTFFDGNTTVLILSSHFTNVVISNPTHSEAYLIQHYVIKFLSDLWQVIFFPGYSGFLHPIKLTTTIELKYC